MSGTRKEWAQKRRTIWARDNGCCHYCGLFIPESERTLDHIVPKAFGGPDANWNLVAACEPCNGSWADASQKCNCGACKAAISRFHREKKRGNGNSATVVWTRRPHRSDDEIVDLLIERIASVTRAVQRQPDQSSHAAAALRGKLIGLREALAIVAVNAVEDPEMLSVSP